MAWRRDTAAADACQISALLPALTAPALCPADLGFHGKSPMQALDLHSAWSCQLLLQLPKIHGNFQLYN